jgi:hypothetical protein
MAAICSRTPNAGRGGPAGAEARFFYGKTERKLSGKEKAVSKTLPVELDFSAIKGQEVPEISMNLSFSVYFSSSSVSRS